MAALTATKVGDRLPQGRYVQQTFNVTVVNAAAADEWFATGFKSIVAVLGFCALGTAAAPAANFVKNAQGTGVAAGTNQGDLGIEAAAGAVFEVTVLALL